MPDILKKYVCLNPFQYLDIQPNSQYVCCPSWCPTNLREDAEGNSLGLKDIDYSENLKRNWFSKSARDIRLSVTDGTYRHCDHKVCPSLSKLINTGEKPSNFVTKEQFDSLYNIDEFDSLPKQILFGFDRSCNFKCPSCRADLIVNDAVTSDAHKIKEFLLQSVENDFANDVESIMITGSGDPIYSKLYRDYLINFDSSKYKNLKNIRLITNGNLLTEKMWNKLQAKDFIKTIEISIDAGTKYTYENITRLNGDWESLLQNLKFLSTLNGLELLTCSMVVSKYNYKEMEIFYNLISDIFKSSSFYTAIHYRQIVHWVTGAYSKNQVDTLSIFDPTHSEYEEFLKELKKIHNKPHVDHNFHHLLSNE